jgi:hypothetical protein
MKFLYCLLPLMGAALAQDLVEDKCDCPQVKCPADDAAVSPLLQFNVLQESTAILTRCFPGSLQVSQQPRNYLQEAVPRI